MKTYAIIAAAALSAAACIPIQPEIYQASSTGGDFSLLSCSQLTVAEGSVRQRVSTLDPNSVYAFGVVTPQGAPVAERRMILTSAASELGTIRDNRNCGETAPLVTADEVLAQPTVSDPAAPESQTGRYLQVATFESTENRDAAIAALRAQGVSANAQPVMLAGKPHHRIIIGPLRSREEIGQADAAAASIGLSDGFFTDG